MVDVHTPKPKDIFFSHTFAPTSLLYLSYLYCNVPYPPTTVFVVGCIYCCYIIFRENSHTQNIQRQLLLHSAITFVLVSKYFSFPTQRHCRFSITRLHHIANFLSVRSSVRVSNITEKWIILTAIQQHHHSTKLYQIH